MKGFRPTLVALLISTLVVGPAAAQQSPFRFNSPTFRHLQQSAPTATTPAPDARGVQELDPETLTELGLSPDDLQKLEDIARLIQREWVDGDSLTSARLRDGAIRGMVKELDPHSEFFNPDEWKAFQQQMTGSYAGIGAVLKKKVKGEGQGVQLPYPDSPAAKAGVKADDVILEIDGANVGPMEGDEVVKRLKGQPGTQVTVKLARPDTADPKKDPQILTIKITRGQISVPNMFSEVLDGNVGYLYFNEFRDQDTEFSFEKQIKALKAKGIARLIIDERNNGGGSVRSVIKMAGMFLNKGQKIVSMKDRAGNEKISYAPADGAFVGLPVKILVNGYSASASEILAGALQDNGKARIVGSQTFGKGSAQAIIPLGDVGVIKLTVNKWYTPKGNTIQGDEGGLKRGVTVRGGITPDDPITVSEQDEAKIVTRIYQKLMGAPIDPPGPIEDPVLKKALEN